MPFSSAALSHINERLSAARANVIGAAVYLGGKPCVHLIDFAGRLPGPLPGSRPTLSRRFRTFAVLRHDFEADAAPTGAFRLSENGVGAPGKPNRCSGGCQLDFSGRLRGTGALPALASKQAAAVEGAGSAAGSTPTSSESSAADHTDRLSAWVSPTQQQRFECFRETPPIVRSIPESFF